MKIFPKGKPQPGSPTFLLTLVTIAASCAPTIENYSYTAPERYPSRPDTAFVQVYHASPNLEDIRTLEVPHTYDIIASFAVEEGLTSSALTKKAMKKAREIGGDAIIVQPVPSREISNVEFTRIQVWVLRFRTPGS